MEQNLVVFPDQQSKVLAGGVHLTALLLALATSWLAGFAGMVPAIIVWLLQEDRQSFVARHAAEAFNFNFSLFIYFIVAAAFSIFTLGLGLLITVPLILVFALVWFLCSAFAAIAGFKGLPYRYPFTIRVLG